MKLTHPVDVCAATDAELIQICRQGDQSAYGQIVERYQSLVCSIAYNRCGDLGLSEDLAQDAFILAWQKLADLKDIRKFKAWICTIVRNLAHRYSQRSGRSVIRTAADLDSITDIPSNSASPIQQAVTAEEEKLVWQALVDVPENYREPLILFYREEQSVARVAEALDLSEDAVKQRLSRGRKMLQRQLAAVVETVLTDSKPAKAFTAAVLLGLSELTTSAVAAAGVATGTAAAAKSAAGVGSGLGILSLWSILMNLPLIAWLVKLQFSTARSQRERKLFRRSLLFGICGLLFYAAALFSELWWGQYIGPPMLQSLLPAAMMVVFLVPWIVHCRRMGKQVERVRIEEGNYSPPRLLIESDNTLTSSAKVYGLFCLSSLLVLAGPAVLPLVARDWVGLSAMFASAFCISAIAARTCLSNPNWSFQAFGAGAGLTAIVTLGIMVWKMTLWESAFVDFFPWFLAATSALSMAQVIVTAIAWQRVYGRPKSPGEGMEQATQQE